jgi:PAS domain S-box-containing protein
MRRFRIALLIPLLLIVSSLASSVLLFWQERRVANRDIPQAAIAYVHTTLTHLQNMLNTQLAADSLEDARLSLSVTALHSGIRTLLLADENDRVLLANRYLWEGSPAHKVSNYDPATAARVRDLQDSSVYGSGALLSGYYPVTLRIVTGGLGVERVGVLFVEYDTAPPLAAAKHAAVVKAVVLGTATTGVAIAIAVLLHLVVSRRVRNLVTASQRIAAGDLDVRIQPRGNDELAELGRAFDHMARQRKDAEAELVHHRENLERVVEQRTRALRESELRYRMVANFTNDWEVWRGEDGRYLYVSPSCERITGYTAEQFMADPDFLRRIIHPEDRAAFQDHLLRYGPGQQNDKMEFRLFRRDDRMIWIEHICQPIFDDEGKYLGTRASNRDTTDRKQQTLELAKARDSAQAANRAKSVFLANMSHELRTPMNAILGFAQLMQQDAGLSQEHRAQVETIGRSGQHLLTLINDVLEISKIEAGKVTLEPRAMDLGELLETIEQMNRLRAERKGLSLALIIAPEVPHYVRGDDKKLRQVLVNLLSNAIKFTHQGGIEVRVGPEPGTRRIRFEVADTGCGIAPEEQQRIFEAFYQTPDASRRGEGTGLGLTISREYAQLMGGRLEVESTVGKGSLFRFAIPLDAVPQGAVETRNQARRVVAIEPGQPRYRILIAEDRPESRELLRQLLESVGFDVRTAENGEKALHLFQSWHPHFIWMDMRMPVMDGYEATRKIKASPGGHATIVVALTASAFEEDRAEVLATGCDGFLRKPLDVDEIFSAMAEHLGIRYLYAADTAPVTPQAGTDLHALTAGMDPELRTALARASLLLDVHGAHDAIAQISARAPELAEPLGRMVDEFRFDELVKLCGEEPPHPKA